LELDLFDRNVLVLNQERNTCRKGRLLHAQLNLGANSVWEKPIMTDIRWSKRSWFLIQCPWMGCRLRISIFMPAFFSSF